MFSAARVDATGGRVIDRASSRRRAATVAAILVAMVGLASCTSGSSGGSRGTAATSGSASVSASATASPSSSVTHSRPAGARTTAVPAPGGGNISKTVADPAQATKTVPQLHQTASFSAATTAQVVSVRSISAKATMPGETSGPALEIVVKLANSSAAPISLGSVVVNVSDASGAPGNPISGTPASPFRGRLASGHTATGVYVFSLSKAHRNHIEITVSLRAGLPVLVFKGSAQ